MDIQGRLKEQRRAQEEKNSRLRDKFEKVDNRASNYDTSLVDFQMAKREQNEYKSAYNK